MSMTKSNVDAKKVYFIRVNEQTYAEIVQLSRKEERTITTTANRLLKRALKNAAR